MHSTGLWWYIFFPVQFTVVNVNFGVKFVNVEQIQHLVESVKKFYGIVLDTTGSKYCGITLEWDYKNITVDLSMPNYVPTKLKGFDRPNPPRPQHAPHKAPPRFSILTKTCTCWQITPIFKITHKTYTTLLTIFLILWTGDRPNYNQNPQQISDAKICTDRKDRPGCKTLSLLLCHTSWFQNNIFCIRNYPTSPLRRVIHEWDQGT